jgi:capsular exopolysaccharide synthesis family protein
MAAVNASGSSSSTDAAASGLISTLRSQQAQLSAQRADLAQRYGRLHPDLARIDRQLADINSNISNESQRIRSGLAADLREASGRSASLSAALNRAQSGLRAGNTASVQLAELQRNADSARGLYQAFLDRYRQAVAGQGTDRSDAYVISQAPVPGLPDFPQLPLFVIGGIVAALLAATVLVLLLELLENGFQSRQEIESKLGVPVLANVPDLRSIPGAGGSARGKMGPANYLVENDGTIFGEAFRSIRTSLRLGHSDQAVRSLAICSALPSEGKTTTAICLARSGAMAGLRVVLVDCDMRRRISTRAIATDESGAGLIEVLNGEATLEQALVRDEATGMFVLGQSKKGARGYDLLTSQKMEELVRELGGRFDFVVLDTAPILPLAEARAVAAMADGVLFVTRWRKTPVRAAQLALDMLARAGAHVQGAALTLVNLRAQARGGYGDEMTYYNKFKSYYA